MQRPRAVSPALLATARRNLLLRSATATVLLPVTSLAVWAGNPLLLVLTAVVVLLGVWEMRGIATGADWGFVPWLALAVAILVLPVPVAGKTAGIVLLTLAGAVILGGAAASFLGDIRTGAFSRLAASLGAALYVAGLASAIPAIRNLPDGFLWLLFLLTTVWAYDIFAYLVGAAFGRHAFAPRLSPRKTWEGVAGGFMGAMVAAGFMSIFLDVSAWLVVGAAALIAVAAQAGDLFESALKRRAGLKDSGRLVPGHGGILDRIDSLLFAGPVAYAVAALSLGPG